MMTVRPFVLNKNKFFNYLSRPYEGNLENKTSC